jgi:radical SAM protein with 4Fe4S-binding SPASM domain
MNIKDEYLPSLAVWELTLKCNLKCLHCGSSAGKPRPDELSTAEGVKLIRDLAEIGFRGVALMGGEPFLRRDWYTIGKEIKDLGMKLSIITNGNINPKNVLFKLVKLEIDSLSVGLDGATAKTHDHIRGVKGAFDKAKEFIHLSKKAGLPISIITTVHKLNFNELSAMRDFVLDLGVNWQVQEAIPIGRFPRNMALSEEEYYSLGLFVASTRKKYSSKNLVIGAPHNVGFNSQFIPELGPYSSWSGCWAGKMVLGIQSDGSIKGCLALSDEFVEGNIHDKSVIDIWNSPSSFRYSRAFNKKDIGENCRDCKYKMDCKGGCTTRSTSFTGISHNDPYCFYRIERKLRLNGR